MEDIGKIGYRMGCSVGCLSESNGCIHPQNDDVILLSSVHQGPSHREPRKPDSWCETLITANKLNAELCEFEHYTLNINIE